MSAWGDASVCGGASLASVETTSLCQSDREPADWWGLGGLRARGGDWQGGVLRAPQSAPVFRSSGLLGGLEGNACICVACVEPGTWYCIYYLL